MTRRERMERRMERRQEWAGSAARESSRRFDAAHNIVKDIPLGQPILVGHHSEGRHRRALDRMASNMTKGCEAQDRAKNHESKAAGIADQLDRSIYSDDADAVQQLEARIAEREAEAARCVALNKAMRPAWRKVSTGTPEEQAAAVAAVFAAVNATEAERRAMLNNITYDWRKEPMFPAYHLSNLRGRINADRERLAAVKASQERAARAEAEGGVVVEGTGDYVRVTFAEKPAREILDALRGAAFSWSHGSWIGRRDALPPVLDLIRA